MIEEIFYCYDVLIILVAFFAFLLGFILGRFTEGKVGYE